MALQMVLWDTDERERNDFFGRVHAWPLSKAIPVELRGSEGDGDGPEACQGQDLARGIALN